jgi:hypothetical protein
MSPSNGASLRPSHRLNIEQKGSVLKVEMVVKTRDFTALKTEACGLTQAAYLHFSNTTNLGMLLCGRVWWPGAVLWSRPRLYCPACPLQWGRPYPQSPGRGTGTTHALGDARPLWHALGPHPQGRGESLGVGRTKAERVVPRIFSRVLRKTVMASSQQYRLRRLRRLQVWHHQAPRR